MNQLLGHINIISDVSAWDENTLITANQMRHILLESIGHNFCYTCINNWATRDRSGIFNATRIWTLKNQCNYGRVENREMLFCLEKKYLTALTTSSLTILQITLKNVQKNHLVQEPYPINSKHCILNLLRWNMPTQIQCSFRW